VVNSAWRFAFLVHIWAEPREVESLPAVLRARIRDLGTDEEKYVGSFAELEQVVEARLDADGVSPRRWERP
jgi:hypothetical protein